VTLDIPYATFSASITPFSVAFGKALGPLLGVAPADVVVVRAEKNGTMPNGTVLFFSLVSPTAQSAASAAALFTNGAAPTLLAALKAQGLPVAAVTYGNALPAPPPPLGTFSVLSQGSTIAFNVPFSTWQSNAYAYNGALSAALAKVLDIPVNVIWVYQVAASANGLGSVVTFDIAAAEQASDSSAGAIYAPHFTVAFAGLFTHTCTVDDVAAGMGPCAMKQAGQSVVNGFATLSGDGASPALLAALLEQGLPVTNAFYAELPF